MKAYVITTGVLFGLLTLVHAWRALAVETQLATDPWFVVATAISAALCVWAWLALRFAHR